MWDSIHEEILKAEKRIRPYVRTTFMEFSPVLSEICQAEVHLKLENLQHTGSFKVRGALNKILSLSDREAARGVVTASTGNHALATAYALELTHRRGVVYLPNGVSVAKLRALRRYQVDLVFSGENPGQAESEARLVADREGRVYISPYNDLQVVGGQGTVGIEMGRQVLDLEAAFVSVGGGGLVSGIGVHLKALSPRARLFGCLPENSPAMFECVRAGRIFEVPCRKTLSDGTAGDVEPGSITFELCRHLVDRWILVSEEEIGRAMRLMLEEHHLVVEGSAAVAVASLLRDRQEVSGQKVVVVICGGNVDSGTLRMILENGGWTHGNEAKM